MATPTGMCRVNFAIEMLAVLKYDHQVRDAICEKYGVARWTAKKDIQRAKKLMKVSESTIKTQIEGLMIDIIQKDDSNKIKISAATLLARIVGIMDDKGISPIPIKVININDDTEEPEGDAPDGAPDGAPE